jgi:hypothetical protein
MCQRTGQSLPLVADESCCDYSLGQGIGSLGHGLIYLLVLVLVDEHDVVFDDVMRSFKNLNCGRQ